MTSLWGVQQEYAIGQQVSLGRVIPVIHPTGMSYLYNEHLLGGMEAIRKVKELEAITLCCKYAKVLVLWSESPNFFLCPPDRIHIALVLN